jgi:hypothetical protein
MAYTGLCKKLDYFASQGIIPAHLCKNLFGDMSASSIFFKEGSFLAPKSCPTHKLYIFPPHLLLSPHQRVLLLSRQTDLER